MRPLFLKRKEGEVYNDAFFKYFYRRSWDARGFIFVATFSPIKSFVIRFQLLYQFAEEFLRIGIWPFTVKPDPKIYKDNEVCENDLLLKAAIERQKKEEDKKEMERTKRNIYNKYK